MPIIYHDDVGGDITVYMSKLTIISLIDNLPDVNYNSTELRKTKEMQ